MARVLAVALLAFIFFKFVCIPFRVKGYSMEPTYRNGGINLCFKLKYLFSTPKRGDVVTVRLAGEKVMLLKRIVATEGETVEFINGKLLINGKKLDEPYIKLPCEWNLSPRKVEKNKVYVIGDNRSVPIERHNFGQTSIKRITGVPLW